MLLYGYETWKVNKSDNQRLDILIFKCLRMILKIRWRYVVSDENILIKTKVKISSEVGI